MLRSFLFQRVVQQHTHFAESAPHFRQFDTPRGFQLRVIEDCADDDGTVIGRHRIYRAYNIVDLAVQDITRRLISRKQ